VNINIAPTRRVTISFTVFMDSSFLKGPGAFTRPLDASAIRFLPSILTKLEFVIKITYLVQIVFHARVIIPTEKELEMKTATRASVGVLILLLATSALLASGQVGIYAVVSKVVFEPNDKAPERIQIWGAFTLVEGGTGSGGKTLTPQRGYLYFALPSGTENANRRDIALKEWADFKAIVGTNQAVAFGRFGYIGAFADELISRPAGMPPYILMDGIAPNFNIARAINPIRSETATPVSPDPYPLNMGLTKLSSTGNLADVVSQLQRALKP
jgi:hypothetical protein